MSTLALRLAGPMQSWGMRGRFRRRSTELEPTKSGVVGLLGAALGRSRTDPIADLADLQFGVRVDQQGHLLSDFQTASQNGVTAPLSYRHYLSDAVFLAAVEGPNELIQSLDSALNNPVYPLFLGRRAFPPAGPPSLGVRDESLVDVLHAPQWYASQREMRSTASTAVRLRIVRDTSPEESGTSSRDDVPISFDPDRRLFSTRTVIEEHVTVTNPFGKNDAPQHDPFGFLGGSIVPQ